MTNNANLNEYEQAEKELKAAITDANKKFQTAKDDIAARSRLQLFNALNDATKLYALVPLESRLTIWSDKEFLSFAKELGLKPIPKKGKATRKSSGTALNVSGATKSGVRHPDFTDEVVLEYIRTNNRSRNVGQVESHFMSTLGVTKPTVTKRINSLIEKDVVEKQPGPKNTKILVALGS
jgi:hypothetical protein